MAGQNGMGEAQQNRWVRFEKKKKETKHNWNIRNFGETWSSTLPDITYDDYDYDDNDDDFFTPFLLFSSVIYLFHRSFGTRIDLKKKYQWQIIPKQSEQI